MAITWLIVPGINEVILVRVLTRRVESGMPDRSTLG